MSLRTLLAILPYVTFLSAGLGPPKVLVLPHPFVPSHVRCFNNLIKELVARKYNVTVLHWPATDTTAEIVFPEGSHVVPYSTSRHSWVSETIDNIIWKGKERYTDYVKFVVDGLTLSLKACYDMEKNAQLMLYLKNQNYSLAIIDPHASPCSWIIVNQLGIPYVSLSPSSTVYYMEQASSNPVPMSYVPSIVNGRNDKMTYFERLATIFEHYFLSTSIYWNTVPYYFELTSFLHNKEPWLNVAHHPTLFLFHTNTLIEFPKPLTHTQINVGQKEFSKEPIVDELISSLPENKSIIIVSLTTVCQKELMSQEMKDAFIYAFQKFPDYHVVWRTAETPVPKSRIPNIQYTGWFNQSNLVADKRTKILINHAGLASILEAAIHSVPMILVPMAFDHHAMAARVVNSKFGIIISMDELSGPKIAETISQLLNDDKYSNRVAKLKHMFDTEQEEKISKPMVWWTEYAIRHGYTLERLRAKGGELWTLNYFGLDIFLLFVVLCYFIV